LRAWLGGLSSVSGPRHHDQYLVASITLNSVVYLRDFKGYAFNLNAGDIRAKGNSVSRRLEYLTGKTASRPKKRNKLKNKK